MRLDLTVTEHLEAPVHEVWRAITDRRLLAQWLMDNDFVPELGARFVLRSDDATPGWPGWVACEVIELDPPTRMVWSWSDGVGEANASRVIFDLREDHGGTRLTIRHVGEADEAVGRMILERWPVKVRALARALGDEP